MAREKFQTLTEQMFYVLLCLREECCGMDLMERIRLLTSGRVSVGPGTRRRRQRRRTAYRRHDFKISSFHDAKLIKVFVNNKKRIDLSPIPRYNEKCRGDVPKWLKGPHSKCGRSGNRREGSNPSISAIDKQNIICYNSFCCR